LDRLATLLKQPPIISLVVLYVIVLAWLCMRGRWAEAWHMMLVVLLGVVLGELLKAGFNRARPGAVAPLLDGNSFPSGHVTNASLIAGTLGLLLARRRWAPWVKLSGALVLLSLVSVTAWQRLYLGRHWPSDIIGSILLAGTWLGFTFPHLRMLKTLRHIALASVGLLICFLGFYFFPQMRLTLPSMMTMKEESQIQLSFGERAPQMALSGVWVVHAREPAGPITWMGQGEASITVQLPPGGRIDTLRLAVRPSLEPEKRAVCTPLEIRVNHQPVGRLLLYRGWREYRLRLDPRWIVPGTNVITFRARADALAFKPNSRTVAFLHVHLSGEE
ncbi:MAG: phosphatase PAP2 family protein, partial [Candidatus Binatia bacterium]